MRTARKSLAAQPRSSGPEETPGALEMRPPDLPGWLPKLPAAVFFAVFFLGLWRWIDVSLIYHGGGMVRGFPVFFWGWDFGRENLRYPGGLIEYTSALLAQSLFHAWWGALLLTLQAWVIFESGRRMLRALGAERFALAAFLTPLLLLSIYARYKHLSVHVSSLAFASVAIGACLNLATRSLAFRAAAIVGVAAAVYAAAPAALIVFAAAVAVCELRQRSTWPLALLVLVSAALLPGAIGCLGYGLGLSEAYDRVLPFRWDSGSVLRSDIPTLWAWYGSLPVLAASVLLWKTLLAPRLHSRAASAPKSDATKAKPRQPGGEVESGPLQSAHKPESGVALGLQAAFLALAALGVIYGVRQPGVKAYLQIDYYAWHQDWAKAVAAAPDPPRNVYVESALAQASYHTGGLTQALPRLRSAEDLLLTEQGPGAYWRRSDLYYDLGYVNTALHLLVESGEFWGERPMILQRLAIVNFALGNVDTAKIQLNALLKVPFFGGWARDCLAKLEADPNLQHDPEVNRLRSLMLRSDSVVQVSADEELLALLAANPQNRMAFEFLMTHYLLRKDLAGFVKNLPRIQGFSGFTLPALWDEALVLASQSNPPLDLKGRAPTAEARRRFDAMRQILRACGDNKELAQSKLRGEYGQSYFFYYVLGR